MQIKFTKTSPEVTEAVKDYLNKKLTYLANLVDKHDVNAICEVNLERTTDHHKEGNVFYAEVNLTVGGKQLYAAATKESLYAAIDDVKDTISDEFKKFKNKRATLFRRGAQKIKNLFRGA